MLKTWPLCIGVESSLKNRVLGALHKNSFIALPGKGGHSGRMPLNHVSPLGEDSEKFYSSCSKRV